MADKKNIFVIIGSASTGSSNHKLVDYIAAQTKNDLDLRIFKDLKTLPHFDPELSINNPPKEVVELRDAISGADGVLISTPEYVFSIPAGLKNLIEWCVSTTVFSGKPSGIITASASGQKAHEELQLIMKTVMARFTDETTLLIRGIKGKVNDKGGITDKMLISDIDKFIKAYQSLLSETGET